MRYAIFEFFFENGQPVFKMFGGDMSRSSANDAVKAWGYQAALKGGYMEIIEDSEEAFEARKAETLKYHPRLQTEATS